MKRFNPGTTLFAILLVLILTAAGCSTLSDNSPTGPGETGSTSTSSRDTYAEAFIRADIGGSLTLSENVVYFPPGALEYDTIVSILREGDSTTFHIFPDGLNFQLPVSLTLQMAPAGGIGQNRRFVVPAIYYYNEGSGQWENIGGVPDFGSRVITTQIEHFSRYGTGTPWFI